MNLYELNTTLANISELMEEWAAEHEGDITDFPLKEELEKYEGDLEEKALSIGVWHKNLLSDEKAIGDEIKALTARKKAIANKAESIKKYLSGMLEAGKKLSNSKCVIGWRKSSSVFVKVAPETLPYEFQKIKIDVDKKKLKESCKNGATEYAELVEKNNITIK